MIKKIKTYKGFSIMESLISIAIAGAVFVVFLGILPKVIKTEAHAQRVLIATNLAQEGIEMIRNLRDNNLKQSRSSFFPFFPEDLTADCSIVSCYPKNRSSYTTAELEAIHGAWFDSKVFELPTGFEREISIETEQTYSYKIFYESKITSIVKYNGVKIAGIETIIYNWGRGE